MGVTRDDWRRYSRPVLKTRRWQVLRQIVLERDGWACVDCGTRKGRLEIDHVKPVRSNPELAFDPANCAVRCSSCHASKTRKEVGWKPVFDTPEHRAWGKAVADLATNPNPAT
ncbi:HNH endonuclease [Paracoccus aminovorans]|uniref:HNH endonuclease n=1 Tax=Paracoccus aminovorans TaxID=34004 RepID=UPI002B25B362|nr:HNH endonuclease [Paracoccus aminovorans]